VTRAVCLLVVVFFVGAFPSVSLGQRSASGTSPNTPIEHFVMLMQENHSFDNYFGTYPGADGIPKDACMPVTPDEPGARSRKLPPGLTGALRTPPKRGIYETRSGSLCVKPFELGDSSLDFSHNEPTFKRQYRGGRMDGFIDGEARHGIGPDPGVMGYYTRRDLPYYWKIADRYVLFDRFFQSAAAGSIPNHMFWATGTVGNPRGFNIPREGFRMTTIFDRLEERGISWKFYVKDYDPRDNYKTNQTSPQVHWVPLLSFDRFLERPRLFRHIVDLDEYFEDARRGTLPKVAFIAPAGQSEHPPGSLRAGERFVGSLINALMQSPLWDSSAFMWSYDDWGGFYDHVRPPQVDRFGYGFRVPALLVSPYARRGHIESTTLDFTSALKFIERNWDLEPLASRDARARTISGAFDFSKPPRRPQIIFSGPRPERPKEPNRLVIYGAYGTALGFAVMIVILQVISSLLRRRSGPGPPRRGKGRFARVPSGAPDREPAPDTLARAVTPRPRRRGTFAHALGHLAYGAALGLAALVVVLITWSAPQSRRPRPPVP
jgi:phospholipase C